MCNSLFHKVRVLIVYSTKRVFSKKNGNLMRYLTMGYYGTLCNWSTGEVYKFREETFHEYQNHTTSLFVAGG